jgi:hypothetical protein
MRALLLVGLVLAVFSVPAQAVLPIPSAYGTATIDGVKSPGEWDTATPRAVFATGSLSGSSLYVMDDDVNIYLGLFVPDSLLVSSDIFWTRFDSKHDGITMAGDDEINGSSGSFFDSHFNGSSWAIQDLRYQGSAAAVPTTGGSFFEMSHAINTGDPDDMFVGPGQTVGLCVFYANHGTVFGTDVYPEPCLGGGVSQTDYVDYTISSGKVGADPGRLARAHVSSAPNPVRRGAELAIYYGVTAGGGPSSLGIYSIAGRMIADLGPLSSQPGEHVLHWQGPAGLAPGVYFVRARYEHAGVRSATVIVR